MSSDKKPVNDGATRAGDGAGGFIFALADLASMQTGPGYSSALGPVVEGERTQCGLMLKKAGTGARPHSHPNEQWNYVLKGRLRVEIEGQAPVVAGPGTLIYFPPHKVHATVALPEEDVYFFVVKDLTHGIIGMAADGKMQGAHYEPGFGQG